MIAHPLFLGRLVFQFPELFDKIKPWAQSKNRWLRRATAVSLIVSLRKAVCLKEAFIISDMLFTDEDDMVQKGYGWMLKVGTKHFSDKIFQYVMANKHVMPRTALRYAIEKLPETKR